MTIQHTTRQTPVSRHRFPDVAQADASALTLADFLGAEAR
jgi:hypothetical protein